MIVLHVAENLLTDELASKLIEKEIQFQIVAHPVIPDSILFEHNVPYKMAGRDGQVSRQHFFNHLYRNKNKINEYYE